MWVLQLSETGKDEETLPSQISLHTTKVEKFHRPVQLGCPTNSVAHMFTGPMNPGAALSLKLEDTARYAGLLLAPAEGFGRGLFLPGKKKLIMRFWPILGHFWCPVVTLVTFSSNSSNFERNPKNQKISKNLNKFKKIQKIQKNPKNPKKSKIHKNPKNRKLSNGQKFRKSEKSRKISNNYFFQKI